jgi:Fur family peroxide stress response transcriptional regulator
LKRRTLGDLEAACRERGLRVTRQRKVILGVLTRRSDHPTADEVYDKARTALPDLSRTTVYRVLDTLVEAGVARNVCHPGVAVRYEAMADRHHHLVCVRCNRLIDLVSPGLDGIRLPNTRKLGFEVEDFTVQIRGVCSKCRRKKNKTTRR